MQNVNKAYQQVDEECRHRTFNSIGVLGKPVSLNAQIYIYFSKQFFGSVINMYVIFVLVEK